MIPLGLTHAELQTFADHLASTHTLQTRVSILDLDSDFISDVSRLTLDGQVNVDADAEVTRSLNLTFQDPTHSLNFDSGSPDDGAIYLDRMIRVEQSFWVPEFAAHVEIPVFTGPVVKFDRDGDEVSVEGQGKEALALNDAWRPLLLKKGMRKTTAIQTVLGERSGETRFAMPRLPRERLPESISVSRLDKPWKVAKDIAESMDMQLYYDGDGTCRLRDIPRRSVFAFRSGLTYANITAPLQVTKTGDGLVNTVWVKGGKRLGKRTGQVSVREVAPRSHPLSPYALARNGVPRFYVEVIDNDHFRRESGAHKAARKRLNARLLDTTELTASVLPTPHLDPLDVVHFEHGEFVANIRLRRFSLPITVGGDMSIGTIRRVSMNRKRIRRIRR